MMMTLILQQKYEEIKEKGEEEGRNNVTEVIHSDNCIIIDCCMNYLLLCVVLNRNVSNLSKYRVSQKNSPLAPL